MKDAECADRKKNHISDFSNFHFSSYGHFCTKNCQFSMHFLANSKKKRKIEARAIPTLRPHKRCLYEPIIGALYRLSSIKNPPQFGQPTPEKLGSVGICRNQGLSALILSQHCILLGGFKEDPQLGIHYIERRQAFGRRILSFCQRSLAPNYLGAK